MRNKFLKFTFLFLSGGVLHAQQDLKVGRALKEQSFDAKALVKAPLVPIKRYSASHITFAMQSALTDREPGNAYNYWPMIVTGDQKQPLKIFGDPDTFKSWIWVQIRADEKRGYYWGVLEFTVEGTAHSLPLIASFDRGKTWKYISDIPKAHFTMTLSGFYMNDKGQGEAIFTGDATPINVSRARSTNWGRSWTLVKAPKDVLDTDAMLDAYLSDCSQVLDEGKTQTERCKWRW